MAVRLASAPVLLVLVLVLALGACGFHPMAGAPSDQPAVAEQLAQVDIGEIPDRIGQELRNRLIDHFYRDGRPAKPLYRLAITLDTSQMTLAVQQDVSASRSEWIVTASYVLTYIPTGQVVMSGSSRALPGYNITYAQYSSFVSENAAFERGIVYVGDDIYNRISLYFARDPDQRVKLTAPDWAKTLPPGSPKPTLPPASTPTVTTPSSTALPSAAPSTTRNW
jgi:LPS-assembly lipoprotein